MQDVSPPGSRRVLTPTQLNALARSLLEDSFPLVEIEGEISNLARPASGHLYCTLKDRNAQVRCALFKPQSQWLKFRPADGQLVLARGRLTLYEPRGDYQLVLEYMEPAGEGALQRAFEELKRRLQAEGLFDDARKQPLPSWIGRLAVITSPSGAAIHDVLSVLARRFPLLEVDVLPIAVQGADCPGSARRMLERADASGRYDALLLTRGGGSLEDLHGFNDEALARAIAACATPVISAIGHEVDFTIADFVADLRCPTPSAAAERLSAERGALHQQLADLQHRMQRQQRRQLDRCAQASDHLQARLRAQQPLLRLQRARERALELKQRLAEALRSRLRQRRERLLGDAHRLRAQAPQQLLLQRQQHCQRLRIVLQGRMAQQLQSSARALQHLGRTLHAVSPLATLDRGYSILFNAQGSLRSIGATAPGQRLGARLSDGLLQLDVVSCEPTASQQ